MSGRPLVPRNERIARGIAAIAIERSTAAPAVLAAGYRTSAQHFRATRYYQAAGLMRRTAELLEGDLWRAVSSL